MGWRFGGPFLGVAPAFRWYCLSPFVVTRMSPFEVIPAHHALAPLEVPPVICANHTVFSPKHILGFTLLPLYNTFPKAALSGARRTEAAVGGLAAW